MRLYTSSHSMGSHRVRIALAIKGVAVEWIPIHPLKLEEKASAYAAHNPQHLVPSLVTDSGQHIIQSLAIIEYLEEAFPANALLPELEEDRARIRSIAQVLVAETEPLQNLRVMNYLTQQFGHNEEERHQWFQHWLQLGMTALEALLQDRRTGLCVHGDTPGMADCCLVPQVYRALDYGLDMTAFPTAMRVYEHCGTLPAFRKAHPAHHP